MTFAIELAPSWRNSSPLERPIGPGTWFGVNPQEELRDATRLQSDISGVNTCEISGLTALV